MKEDTEKFCERWLCFWTTLAEKLTSEQFTEQDVGNFIAYEMKTRRRKRVLHRLTGRYFKMIRARRWAEMQGRLEEDADSGTGDRGTLEERG